jgi:hypothetical protein
MRMRNDDEVERVRWVCEVERWERVWGESWCWAQIDDKSREKAFKKFVGGGGLLIY